MATNDTILGKVVLLDLPSLSCIESGQQYAEALVAAMGVEFGGGLSGVFVGVEAPPDPAITGIWVKVNSAGIFLGLFVFSGGVWVSADSGGCNQTPQDDGVVLVCHDGDISPLSAHVDGDLLTVIDFVHKVAKYETIPITLITPTVVVPKAILSNSGNVSTETNATSITLTNTGTIRNMDAIFMINTVDASDGAMTNCNTGAFTFKQQAMLSVNGGLFAEVGHRSELKYSPTNTASPMSFDVQASGVISLNLAPGASATIDAKTIFTWAACPGQANTGSAASSAVYTYLTILGVSQ